MKSMLARMPKGLGVEMGLLWVEEGGPKHNRGSTAVLAVLMCAKLAEGPTRMPC